MSYNFMRGRQMIIHDPRLRDEGDSTKGIPPSILIPPPAMNVWTVSVSDGADHIIEWAREVAKGKSGTEKLDALHFMAHGRPGGMQVGKDGSRLVQHRRLGRSSAATSRGAIVFFSCQVVREQSVHPLSYGLTFGNAVATYAGCKVIDCKMNQVYSWHRGNKRFDFGEFEGPVYLYRPGARAPACRAPAIPKLTSRRSSSCKLEEPNALIGTFGSVGASGGQPPKATRSETSALRNPLGTSPRAPFHARHFIHNRHCWTSQQWHPARISRDYSRLGSNTAQVRNRNPKRKRGQLPAPTSLTLRVTMGQ